MSEPTDMPTEGNIDPWSWIPSSWTQGASDALSGGADMLGLAGAQPQPALQPGLLVPPAVVDAAPLAAQPAPVEPRAPGMPTPFDDSLAGAPMTPPMLPPAEVPLPDAITGAGPALGVRQADIGAAIRGGVGALTDNAGAALQGASDATGATSQDERDARLQQLQDATNVANMSPEARAALIAQHEQAAKLDAAAAQVKLAHEQATKIQDNFTAFQKAQTITQAKSDALLADAQRVADTKIDPDRLRNSRSPMQTVAAYIGAIAGGVQGGLPGGGGKNIALEQMNLSIDRDIAAQRSDIENARGGIQTRQSMLAQEYARTGDMYHAQETVRIGLQEQAVREMQAQQQLYDPRGTTAIAMGSAIAGMRSQQQQALQAYQQQQFKNQLDIVTKQQENDKIEEDLRKNRAEEADKKVKNSIAYGQLAETKREHDLADQARKDALAEKAAELKDKQSTKADADEAKSVRNPVTGAVLTDDKGVPLKRGSVELADKMNESIGTAQNFIDAASDARRMLEKDPSLVDRQEWARVTTNLENAKVAFIEKHGAKASSREMEAMSEVMGPNFEGFAARVKDKGTGKARLDTLIDSVDRETLTELKTKLGYKGASPLLKTNKPGESTPTETDKLNEVLSTDFMKRPLSEMSDDDVAWMKARASLGGPGSQTDKLEGEQILKAPSSLVARGITAGVPPSMVQAFDELRSKATGSDKTASEQALGVLLEQAKNSQHETTRDYAAKVLKSIADSSLSTEPADYPAGYFKVAP